MDSISATDRNARRMARLLTFIFWLVAAALLLERLGYAGIYRGTVQPFALLEQLLLSLPAILYLTAVWQLRNALAAVASGNLFGDAVVRAIRRVGALLVVAALVSTFLLPPMSRALGQVMHRLIDLDVATFTIGAVGLGLWSLAHVVRRAAAHERELKEFF